MGDIIGIAIGSVLALVLLAASVPLLRGKGSFLVAGLNTMTPQERARYDVPRICRATGVLMLASAVPCIALAVLTALVSNGMVAEDALETFSIAFIAIIVGGCIILALYTNIKCKRKQAERQTKQ